MSQPIWIHIQIQNPDPVKAQIRNSELPYTSCPITATETDVSVTHLTLLKGLIGLVLLPLILFL